MEAVSVARDPRASKSRELKDFAELTSQQLRRREEQAKVPR